MNDASSFSLSMVSRRTRLSPQLIRAWEARHGAVAPKRSPNGRRIYTAGDVTRLQRLRTLTEAGFTISRIAALSDAALEEMAVREASSAVSPPANAASSTGDPETFVEAAIGAIGRLDSEDLLSALEGAEVALGRPAFLEQVVAVLATRVGAGWRSGALKVAHEHFATAQLRGYLGPFGRVPHGNAATPHLIVTTPPDQWHELGALLVAAAAHSHGWRVTYLGPSMPVEEIAGAAIGYRARAVALSIVYPEDDPQTPRDLVRLRRLLPDFTAMLIGGRAAGALPLPPETGVHLLARLAELYPALDALRRESAAAAASGAEASADS